MRLPWFMQFNPEVDNPLSSAGLEQLLFGTYCRLGVCILSHSQLPLYPRKSQLYIHLKEQSYQLARVCVCVCVWWIQTTSCTCELRGSCSVLCRENHTGPCSLDRHAQEILARCIPSLKTMVPRGLLVGALASCCPIDMPAGGFQALALVSCRPWHMQFEVCNHLLPESLEHPENVLHVYLALCPVIQ